MVERNWGIDLLKIVSMMMVVTLHVLAQGGLLNSVSPLSIKYEILWFIECSTYCAVNCYALISGYIGIDAKYNYSRILMLWCQVFFYNAIIMITYSVYVPNSIDLKSIVHILFPTLSNQYWYFTAYFCMYFFIPILNHIVNTVSQRSLVKMFCIIGILFSIIPTICRNDIFGTNKGWSALWLTLLYMVGAYIKKYDVMQKIKKRKLIVVYGMCILVTWGMKLCIEFVTYNIFNEARDGGFLLVYTSPTIVLASIMLLCFFSQLKVGYIKQSISFWASLSFSVYLIHTHPLIFEHILKNSVIGYNNLNILQMVLYLFITIIFIYFLCSLVDIIRCFIFKLFRVKERAHGIENKMKKVITTRINFICKY